MKLESALKLVGESKLSMDLVETFLRVEEMESAERDLARLIRSTLAGLESLLQVRHDLEKSQEEDL